jgi:hypothetical protein
MLRFTPFVLIALLLTGSVQRLAAFSLNGPAAPFMTIRLGYDVNPQIWPNGQGWGGAGPMALGEEYRLNYPTVTYGFTPTFLEYFGQRGVAEIDKAAAILNALPSMDTININDYPLLSQRVNHRASALSLVDVKSLALSVFVNQMGLADPSRFVYVLRNRFVPTPNSTNFFVIPRNFDPDTWKHSPYINGQLWTYTGIADGDTRSIIRLQPVDPLALGGLINSPVAAGVAGNQVLLDGGFWTGLTRDDVGGLRYIYRRNNYNLETAPTNSFRAGIGAPVTGGSSSPWTTPNFGTNTGGAIPGVGTQTNFVDLALRPGIGSIRFVRLNAESVLGSFRSNTIAFVDRFVTNGVEQQQTLARITSAPDILFGAGDLQGDDTGPNGFNFYQAAAQTWNSTGDGTTSFGPGTIPPAFGAAPSLILTLNSVGPTILNGIIGGTAFLSEANSLGRLWLWGSFDGSAEEPIVYPDRLNTELIEQAVLGGGLGGGGDDEFGGATVGTWTPATLIALPPGSNVGGVGGVGGGGAGGDVGGLGGTP